MEVVGAFANTVDSRGLNQLMSRASKVMNSCNLGKHTSDEIGLYISSHYQLYA